MSDFGDLGGTSQEEPSGIGSDGSEQQVNPDVLGNPFLSKIPVGDREIVAKYIKDWDRGVTQRFQQIHQQYQPYKDLGASVEDLQGAWALQQMINEDPNRVYELLGQIIGNDGGQQQQQQQPQVSPEFEDLPAPFVEKFTRMEQILENLAGRFLESEQAQSEAAEDQALDD